MRTISATVPVNDPDLADQVRLDRDDVWSGLLRKARNAVPFVPAMTECTVVEHTPEGLVREVVLHGERVREEVAFHPKRRVSFSRRDERATWLIHNDIGEDETGLTLTFSATVALGQGEEDEREAERMRAGYLQALRTTLALTRESVAGGSATPAP
ncbi:SRPBCC family protein [Streptomyces sp. NPDC018031]|uniref:SRPBCC family protein n=1 Tax=Streptomyces sp. NPDC018031 TaxID=3365033 RepID=UPI0037AA05D2